MHAKLIRVALSVGVNEAVRVGVADDRPQIQSPVSGVLWRAPNPVPDIHIGMLLAGL